MEEFDYPGVYGLSVDGKIVYVGSSKNIKNRIKQHFYLLRKGKHKKTLQDAFNNGKDIVPICLERLTMNNTIGELYTSESYWIDKINPVCTDRKPSSKSPLDAMYDLARYAAESKSESENAKYEYIKVSKDNSANNFYSSIVYHAARYFTPIKYVKNGSAEKIYGAFLVSPTYEEAKAVREKSRRMGITAEQYILEAIHRRIESER